MAAKSILASAPAAPFPKVVRPMLATLSDQPFNDPDWVFEVKWDGYRAIAMINGSSVLLQSRNDKSFEEKFYPIFLDLKKWKARIVLDGEIVVVDQSGSSNFGALQNWRSEADGELIYYVFDVLWLDGRNLKNLTLRERRNILKKIKLPSDNIRLSEGFEESGIDLFESVKKIGLEGIIAKKLDSVYHENDRTRDWLKIKTHKRQEVVIGGYTLNEGSNKLFSSLLVGVFEKGKLLYTGKIGTGFNQKMQADLMKKFKALVVKTSPFNFVPDVNKPSRFRPDPPKAKAVWLRPQIICEVSFAEMTTDGVMRHPSYEGLRSDKKPETVVLEKEIPLDRIHVLDKSKVASRKTPRPDKTEDHKVSPDITHEIQPGKNHATDKTTDQKNIIMAPISKGRKSLLNPSEETQVKKINGHDLKFSNLSKIYWPKEKVTKRDMLNYYYQVAPFILPYIKDRPQSLNRHPNGIDGMSFYQKDVKGKAPEWTEKFDYHSSADERDKEYLVCTDEASLLYIASLGCIEINPWSSTVDKPDNPNWCIIDFDPDKNPFNQVIEAARVTHAYLESIGVDAYCKTSGSTGLHIYIPLGAKYSYEESKEFARAIVTAVHAEIPKYTSIERPTANRKGKIYLDFLQNRPQATLAAPYSLRPKPGATVSMPLHWDELKKGLQMKDFTIKNAIERIQAEGDLFKPVLGKGINLAKAMKMM